MFKINKQELKKIAANKEKMKNKIANVKVDKKEISKELERANKAKQKILARLTWKTHEKLKTEYKQVIEEKNNRN